MVENQRGDIARQRQRVVVLRRERQRVLNRKVHRAEQVLEELYVKRRRLPVVAEHARPEYSRPLQELEDVLKVRRGRRRFPAKVSVAVGHEKPGRVPK